MKLLIKNQKELQDFANQVFLLICQNKYHHATVLALQGDLGSGKTTFTKELAKLFKITETITSPTFVIKKNFEINNQDVFFEKLIHIDSYRLDLAKELENLGWHDDLNNQKNLIVVEWPERVLDLMPKNYFLIKFEHVDETTREVEVILIDAKNREKIF